jgi:polar amino acid transport system substrate-binding protein
MNRLILTLLILLSWATLPLAKAVESQTKSKLKIAVCDRPPFCYREGDRWSGLSIALWEQVAQRLGLSYEYDELPFSRITQALGTGECDLSPVLALSLLSQEHSLQLRFTEPYLVSHGALLTRRECAVREMLTLGKRLVNRQMLLIFGLMLAGMILFSIVLLAIERRRHQSNFHGSNWKGFGSALWLSASTMTSLGYSDTSHLSVLSRVVSFLWMLFGVLVIAIFTGSVSSSLTMADITSGIIHFHEINRFDAGVLKGSRMDELLETRGIPALRYDSLESGLDALRSGKSISAFAGDEVSLGYLSSRSYAGEFHMSLIPQAELLYAFACRPGLHEFDVINGELMKIALSPDWHSRCERWIGPSGF